MSHATKEVTDSSFDTDVMKSSIPVVVDFWAPWCGPCRAIAPSLEVIANELSGKIIVAKVNIDENPNAATKYGVRSIPTLMIFKNGALASTKVGAIPQSELARWVGENI